MNQIEPQWTHASAPLTHSWQGVVNIDQFRWLSRKDVLRQLERARDEIGARHVRACAMYSPEMRLRKPPVDRWRDQQTPVTTSNWQMVDLNIESLLEIGLKPMYTTCFTPTGFTDRPTCCWPDRNPVGMPRDLEQWKDFVEEGLRHHVRRYGREEMRQWWYECWNEPNLSGFFEGTQEEFFQLWEATWKAVKAVDADFQFGGPSTARGEWIPEFLAWTRKRGCEPDYIITHVYNNDSDSEPLSPFDGPASHRVKDSPHFAVGVIRGVKARLVDMGWDGPIHWNEWGRSWFPHDPRRETALEGAFVAKTMIEAGDCADAFAFWNLSDIYDQIGIQSAEFQGHYGMLSLHGIAKPAYQAHRMLCRLGQTRVPVRVSGEEITALASRGAEGDAVLIARYPPDAVDKGGITTALRVTAPAGVREARLIRLGSAENNPVARWREEGSDPYPAPEAIRRLREADGLSSVTLPVNDGVVTLDLECPGVALLEFGA